jgi:hypothetical protein
MAYFSKEDKEKVSPRIKEVLKKFGVNGSIAINNHSTLVVNIQSGKLDFLAADKRIQEYQSKRIGREQVSERTYLQVHQYYAEEWHREVEEHTIADFFKELYDAMRSAGWFDKSDAQTDYFHTAYYMDVNVGRWNKPYELKA